MTRRGAIIAALLAPFGQVKATTVEWWKPQPMKIRISFKGETGVSSLEFEWSNGDTLTLNEAQIRAALEADHE